MKKLIKIPLLGFSTLLISTTVLAVDVRDFVGDKIVNHRSPRGLDESCVIPSRLEGAIYSKGDLEKEAGLCEQNFYDNVGLCPKYNSTNPGVILLKPNAQYTKAAIDASNCNLKTMDVKKASKYKQSISCSYTPSILGYYHVSRALGGAGNVPPVVLRTMDAQTHKNLMTKANNSLAGSKSLIAQTWAQFSRVHSAPQSYPQIFDNSLNQVYGALVYNVKGEANYNEVNGFGSYDTRYERFFQQKAFLNVADSRTASQIIGSSNFAQVAQTVVQMKDVSDMIILDTLMSQQDRIGNIHYKYSWYFLSGDKTEGYDTKKSDADIEKNSVVIPAKEKAEMAPKNAVLVKEMILKDNDCGVVKSNMMAQFGGVEQIKHMSYETYQKLAALQKSLMTKTTQDYFMKGLLFNEKDYSKTAALARKIMATLKAKCQSGELRFDVDLQDYVPGAVVAAKSCNI